MPTFSLPTRVKKLESRLLALPDDCDAMLLSELDGFLAGVLVCPELIEPSEWLPAILRGEDAPTEPAFVSDEELRELIGLIVQHHNTISRELHRGPVRYAPIYTFERREDEVDVLWELWIEGFHRAMTLRPDSWDAIVDSDDDVAIAALALMQTLAAIAREQGEALYKNADSARLRELAPSLIPLAVMKLNNWRLKRDAASPSLARLAHGKIGRNAPCPCGSGKKYKKCCALSRESDIGAGSPRQRAA